MEIVWLFHLRRKKAEFEVDKALETDMLPRSPIAVWFFTVKSLQTQEKVEQKHNVNYWSGAAFPEAAGIVCP